MITRTLGFGRMLNLSLIGFRMQNQKLRKNNLSYILRYLCLLACVCVCVCVSVCVEDAARSQLQQGLKINYGKSSFGVLGQSEQWKLQAASYLNYRIMPLPFSYLGIPIGANPEEVPMGWWP